MNESSRTPFLLQCCLCTLHPVLSLYKRNSRALTSRTARRQCRDCPPLLPCEAVCDQGQLPTVQRAPAPLATTRGRGCYPEKTRQRWQQPTASVRGASCSRAGVAARAMTSNQSASLAPDPAAFRLGVYFLRTVARRVSNGYRWPLRRCQRAPSRIAAAFSGPSRACGRLHFRNIRWRPSAVALHGIKVNHHTLDVRNVLSAGKRGGGSQTGRQC